MSEHNQPKPRRSVIPVGFDEVGPIVESWEPVNEAVGDQLATLRREGGTLIVTAVREPVGAYEENGVPILANGEAIERWETTRVVFERKPYVPGVRRTDPPVSAVPEADSMRDEDEQVVAEALSE